MLLLAIRHREDCPWWQVALQLSATAALFIMLAERYGLGTQALVPIALAVTAAPLAIFDARTRRLPNWLMLHTYALVASATAMAALRTGAFEVALRTLAGALLLLTFCGTLYVLFPGQLGGGDVKIAGPLGAVLASAAWSAVFAGLLLGWTLAAIAQLFLRAVRRDQAGEALPLGTFLLIGTFATLLLTG
ncbi:leader peptidase (prepilin peptidase)/N-methyltransferase [Saccharopolyspora lacisalsi]|uniref:Leader peptidase (Prepilin peptidase)/N-methyltransferase n=1 Tax=Halosaccharopolyspora lacisalsi TaxID=1000566 RepID=A0A839DYG3_9PSEU|nr:prepilin peptidase [Halosaccharopolyspora lacisalsi]MBA8823798.1 leader peptidase (prepilin peptidase)/N-methyltransferase [Halosaccharopolyspora lacisalsi]